MKKIFAWRCPSPAEAFLHGRGIDYKRRSDGRLIVECNIDLSGQNLTRLPDLSAVIVKGGFYCYNNQLTTLAGAPQAVVGVFHCYNNQLTTLAGAPQAVGGDFYCYNNQLTTLAGAPQAVGGGFYCHNNLLTTLAGAPQAVGGSFYCCNNHLATLEHAPQAFKILSTDFGVFSSWETVPEHLRTSPETKARIQNEKEAAPAAAATVLQAPSPAKRPLLLRL